METIVMPVEKHDEVKKESKKRISEKYASQSSMMTRLFFLFLLCCFLIIIYVSFFASPPVERRGEPVVLKALPVRGARLAVPEFIESPTTLQGIEDETLGTMKKLSEPALSYLIHKMRSSNIGLDLLPTADEQVIGDTDELMDEAGSYRGKAMSFEGRFDISWPLMLYEGNPSGLSTVTMGKIRINETQSVFFIAEDSTEPENLSEGDRVVVYGYFLQRYYDVVLQEVAPLLITRRVRRNPPEPFVENDVVLESVLDSRDFLDILNHDAYYYLLHKSYATSQEDIVNAHASKVGMSELFQEPDQYRGQVIYIYGEVARPFRYVKLSEANSTGISYAWEGQVAVKHRRQTIIVTILFLERPEFVDKCHVEFYGYFLQKWGYRKKHDADKLVVSPFLIGKQVTLTP